MASGESGSDDETEIVDLEMAQALQGKTRTNEQDNDEELMLPEVSGKSIDLANANLTPLEYSSLNEEFAVPMSTKINWAAELEVCTAKNNFLLRAYFTFECLLVLAPC